MRSTSRVVAATILLALGLTACNVVPGSGKAASETRQVSGFTRVDLAGVGELVVAQGDAESLTVEADDNVLSSLTSEVANGTLSLGRKQGFSLRSQTPIRYRVTLPTLDGLILSGSGTITATDLSVEALDTDISGSGVVVVTGTASSQNVSVSGSGKHEASQLATERAVADVSGSGEILLTVSTELKATISGSGTVTYSGDPQVTESISGSGRLIKK